MGLWVLAAAIAALWPATARADDAAWCNSAKASAAKLGAVIEERQPTLFTVSSDAIGWAMVVCHYIPVEISADAPAAVPSRSFYEAFAALAAGIDHGAADEIRDALAACVGVAGAREPFERVSQPFSRGAVECSLSPGASGFVQFHLTINKARPG